MKACVIPVMLCVAGCVAPPKNLGLESETETNVSGSGSGSGSESESASESESESESETGPVTDCDFADAASCEAATDCAWVELTTVMGGDDYCGFFEEPRNACIKTFYQGEGCEYSPACGVDESSPVFYVEIDNETYDFVTHPFCENQPVGYQMCRWDGDQLISGPFACDCLCLEAPPVLPGNVEEQLVEQSGCSDVFVFAYDDDSRLALTFTVDGGYATEATETGMPVDVELEVGGAVEVQINTGFDLQSAYCTDVGGKGSITGTWTATEGTAALHIEIVDDQPRATVTLSDVIFAPDAPAVGDYFLGDYVFTDVLVGWLPG
jgi:hypothetical protein